MLRLIGLQSVSVSSPTEQTRTEKLKDNSHKMHFIKNRQKRLKDKSYKMHFIKTNKKRLKDQSHKMYPFSYSESRFLTGRSEAIYLDMSC